MAINDLRRTVTTRITNATMDIGALGALINESTALFLDFDGANDIDGMLISQFQDRQALLFDTETSGVAIAAAVDQTDFYKGQPRILITPASEVYPKKNESFSAGTFDGPGYAAPVNVASPYNLKVQSIVAGTTPQQFYVTTMNRNVNAAALAGMSLFRTFQYAGIVELGYLTLGLGQGVAGANVRVAIIATPRPADGLTFAERTALNEVMWSKFYPIGTQVSVDFSGFTVRTGDFIPPTYALSPNDGENRVMLAFYWESGTPVAFTLNAELTYVQHTVSEFTPA